MKKRLLLLILLFIVFSAQQALANVYASQLKITNPDSSAFDGDFEDGTGAVFHFFLNDSGFVTIDIFETGASSPAFTIPAGAEMLPSGKHEVTYGGAGLETGKAYTFSIRAEQPNKSATGWTVFYDSGDIGIFTRGVDIIHNMGSPRFGKFYAPSTGGPLGKGITIYNPDGSGRELVAADQSSGGSIDWGGGTQTMFSGVFDDADRFYVSAILFGEIRRLNTDTTITAVIAGLTNPKGLFMAGTGADRVLYICDDKRVLRAAIGEDDVFQGTPEVVAEFQNAFPRNIALDDEGFMYISLRSSNELNSDPLGLFKYDISGTLPVKDGEEFWLLSADQTFRVAGLAFDYGADRSSATDDILYFSTRDGDGSDNDGVWRVNDISDIFTDVTQLISDRDLYGSDENINDRAAIVLDPAGNIILMENSNEHVFFISPPGEGQTNNFTTSAPDTFTVGKPTGVDEDETGLIPAGYVLHPAYPNPFNPSTTISYVLPIAGQTRITIFDYLGRAVRVLVDEAKTVGDYSVVWDGRDDFGREVSSGVYVVTLVSGTFKTSQRVTLLK